MFYLLLPDEAGRNALIEHLRACGLHAVFHYVPLHSSPMGRRCGRSVGDLPVTDTVSGRLVRLPFFFELGESEQREVAVEVARFLRGGKQ